MTSRLLLALLALPFFATATPVALAAELEAEETDRTPPRLSMVDGEISYFRPGSDDWVPAHVNLPLAAGDELYSGEGSNLELQVGGRAFVRAGELTQLRVDDLQPDLLQLSVTNGHLALDLSSMPAGQTIEVDTPNSAIILDHQGYYRLRVAGDVTILTVRRDGRATVRTAGGEAIVVEPDQQVAIDGSGDGAVGSSESTVRVVAAGDPDVWDRWNYDRSETILSSDSKRYVSEDVYGLDDLDEHGTWQQTPNYGWVWRPTVVSAGWVPYSTGRWIYDPYYGWTWLDDAAWGWAPYHYGRWVYASNYWAWAPGPIIARPYYAPALVGFYGGGVSVSVGFGAPFVGWVALGWGEPFIPWWGSTAFIGRPCWYGWGGPRYYNGHVVHGHHHRHGHWDKPNYHNARVHNAVLGVDRDHFGRGRQNPRRLAASERGRLDPVRGRLGVNPDASSLRISDRSGRRPPDVARNRSVVATRRPHDPETQLRAAGMRRGASAEQPSRRLVGERPARETLTARQSNQLDQVRRWRSGERDSQSPTGASRFGSTPHREPPTRSNRRDAVRQPDNSNQPEDAVGNRARRGSSPRAERNDDSTASRGRVPRDTNLDNPRASRNPAPRDTNRDTNLDNPRSARDPAPRRGNVNRPSRSDASRAPRIERPSPRSSAPRARSAEPDRSFRAREPASQRRSPETRSAPARPRQPTHLEPSTSSASRQREASPREVRPAPRVESKSGTVERRSLDQPRASVSPRYDAPRHVERPSVQRAPSASASRGMGRQQFSRPSSSFSGGSRGASRGGSRGSFGGGGRQGGHAR